LPGVLWAAWWLMMASHEAGHVIATLLSGGRIARIDLSPLAFSQTHLSVNPHPLFVVWAGPVMGVVDPVLAWLVAVMLRRRDDMARFEPAFAFLAGFCLIANGVYLGLGWVDRVGDTGEMMRLGTPVAVMIAFGVVCVGLGLALWHRLGSFFGLKNLSTADAKHLLFASIAVLLFGFLLAGLLR